jgi:hypothetical protein
MPAEATRALLGAEFHAPFTPEPPALQYFPVSPELVAAEATAAASAFAAATLAVLDRVARTGVPMVAAGGVGARELAKLANATGVGEVQTRLVLELSYAAGLLAAAGRQLGVTAGFATFRDAEPAERYATLVGTWRGLGATPTKARDEDGKVLTVAAGVGNCGGCRAGRSALLETLAGLDGAVGLEAAAGAALWRRPLVHAPATADGLAFGFVWQEAELLGVVALGVLSPIGRALDDGEALRVVAAQLLPPSVDRVGFGTDLTAYVAGAPSSRVSRLLDGAADRESSGGAVTWRFGPASVRRALDDGADGEELTAALAAVATGALPQSLLVLVADVARRHGNLRLTAAACAIRSDDEPLLAEVVRDRRLKELGLRLLTPTVLVGERPVAETLEVLRKAGYFPLADRAAEESAVPAPVRGAARRTVARPVATVEVDGLVRQLLSAADRPRPTSLTERLLSAEATSLSAPEVRQLAAAIDAGQPIGIGYEASGGAYTERVLQSMELLGNSLAGWCELRQSDRTFLVRRIVSVQAV